MRAKDIEVGEEYLATASTDNRYESDRVRVRVVEAPVEGQAYGFGRRTYSTGRMDSALVEVLDKETGKLVDDGRLYRLKATKAGDGYVIRLATIKMPWSEWVTEKARWEEHDRKAKTIREAKEEERRVKLVDIREFFGDLPMSRAPEHWEVRINLDELHDWVDRQIRTEESS